MGEVRHAFCESFRHYVWSKGDGDEGFGFSGVGRGTGVRWGGGQRAAEEVVGGALRGSL